MSLYAIYREYNSTHLVRESIDRYTERPRETEITQLELALPIDEEILRFEISMKDSIFMAEGGSF